VLRKYGPKRDEIIGDWRKLYNEELYNLHRLSGIIIRMIKSRRMSWTEHVARIGEKRNTYRVFLGEPEGKRSLRRPRRRWKDNIKVDFREIVWGCVDWICVVKAKDYWQGILVNTAINLRVP
jgi:hypothetical protein